MRSGTLISVAMCVAAVAGVAAATGELALAAGDATARAEAIASFTKLNAQSSFRVRWTSPDGTGLAEFVRPHSAHFVGKSSQGSVELFHIGTQNYIHYDVPGMRTGWQCTTSRNQYNTYVDIDKLRKDTTTVVVRRSDTVIDGTPVHGYADADSGDELYVSAQTGLPRRVVEPRNTATADFYDYGAPIAITPPSCG
jgi:hypothetical protein